MVKRSWVERFQLGVARLLLALPSWLARWFAGPPRRYAGDTLDPQLQILLALDGGIRSLEAKRGAPPNLARRRRDMDVRGGAFSPASPPLQAVDELRLDGPGGSLPVRLYRPRGLPEAAPGIVYFHGGGWVVGSLDSHDAVCRALATRARCVVLAVDYRLSPEHRCPAAIDDALFAFRHLAAHADRYGLDGTRLAVGGDSAGGNLAALVALSTRGEALSPRLQLLVYPAVDLTMQMPSVEALGHGYFLERADMEWYRAQYLPAGADYRDPAISPLYADLGGAPPAFIASAGFDPLRDEDAAYAKRLAEAGVPTVHRHYPGLIHGYLNMAGAVVAARVTVEEAAAALSEALGS